MEITQVPIQSFEHKECRYCLDSLEFFFFFDSLECLATDTNKFPLNIQNVFIIFLILVIERILTKPSSYLNSFRCSVYLYKENRELTIGLRGFNIKLYIIY